MSGKNDFEKMKKECDKSTDNCFQLKFGKDGADDGKSDNLFAMCAAKDNKGNDEKCPNIERMTI